jgi:hypothetical protein
VKPSNLPPFKAIGKVACYHHGDTHPITSLVVSVYATDAWSIGTAMERSAKWALERMGTPATELAKLHFEYSGTDELYALEPRGVKRNYDDQVEAFFDAGPDMPKRAILIRQRRLLPNEHSDAMAIYAKPVTAKHEEAVAA